jgi:hypothetical protein
MVPGYVPFMDEACFLVLTLVTSSDLGISGWGALHSHMKRRNTEHIMRHASIAQSHSKGISCVTLHGDIQPNFGVSSVPAGSMGVNIGKNSENRVQVLPSPY